MRRVTIKRSRIFQVAPEKNLGTGATNTNTNTRLDVTEFYWGNF